METQGEIHIQNSPVKAQGGISTQMKDFEEHETRELVTIVESFSEDTLDIIARKGILIVFKFSSDCEKYSSLIFH